MTTDFPIDSLFSANSVHYLGYHTAQTMGYTASQAKPGTLLTSNRTEAYEVTKKYAGQAFIWLIEGRKTRTGTEFWLHEVFQPKSCTPEADIHQPSGIKFDYLIEGPVLKLASETFTRPDLLLNNLDWFPQFKKDNGNFGFGLRRLRDRKAQEAFIELAQPNF